MALTPEEIDAIPDYTTAHIVKLLRRAVVTIAADAESEVEVAGRRYSVHNLATLKDTLKHFEAELAKEVADESGSGPFEFAQL